MDIKAQTTGMVQAQRDYGMQGDILVAVRQMLEQTKHETIQIVHEMINEPKQTSYVPTKLDNLERYLHLLYAAQKSEHAAHSEIDEALKQFKQEAGI